MQAETTWALFPTIIKEYVLGREFEQEEVDSLQELCEEHQMVQNTGNFYTRNTFVLEDERLSKIKQFVLDGVNDYIQTTYRPKYELTPHITQSWLNYTQIGGYHHKHDHPNSFLSGVFYFANSEIQFYQRDFRHIAIESETYDIDNSSSWKVKPTRGSLIVFPSDLQHSVEPTAVERYSLSFNSYLTGEVAHYPQLIHLKL
jgi:uncharacterized protein (TIGR02466 family)